MTQATQHASTSSQPELFTLDTLDHFPTRAAIYHPVTSTTSTSNVKAAILFAAATGVPGIRHFSNIAQWLSSQGHPVLVFDFRYLGLSFPPGVDVKDPAARNAALRSSPETNISLHWARDVGAAIRALHERSCQPSGSPGEKPREMAYIGNSHGGHLLPLALRERDLVTRTMFVSAFTPYYGYLPDAEARMEGAKTLLEASRQEGYFLASLMGVRRRGDSVQESKSDPTAKSLGMGYDLPLACGEQWMRWCNFPRYIATEHVYEYSSWQPPNPVVSISFTDDSLTQGDPLPSDQMLATLPQARHHRLVIDPLLMGKGWEAECGHVNCFRPAQREGAWVMIRDWAQLGSEPIVEGPARLEFGGLYKAKAKM